MKRLLVLSFFLLLPAISLPAQEHAEQEAREHASDPATGEHGRMELWKWANFVVLAGALGYFAGKNAGPFFAGRSRRIRREMLEAADARKDAEARAADVDRRLANLEAEIAALKSESQLEAQTETERLAAAATAEMAKIQVHAQQEIAAAGKAARTELKRYCAELAVGLAEQKIATRMSPDVQDNLVRGFVRGLDRPSSRAQGI